MHTIIHGAVNNKDSNGVLTEDLLDKYSLVMLNDGRPTRFQVGNGSLSCIDLTFASAELVRCRDWDLLERYTMGSDHFLILSRFGRILQVDKESTVRGFNFKKRTGVNLENNYRQVWEMV
uniref:Endonuclease/exonuclease/phosphatase domain-containing protein n=1 Tax=Anguilla anguilla TaxID=7936 RepID=A0A0E9WK78_ANGAN